MPGGLRSYREASRAPIFHEGTLAVAKAVAASGATSIVRAGIRSPPSHRWGWATGLRICRRAAGRRSHSLGGLQLPGVEALMDRLPARND
jgi:hypothetical protein